MTLLTSLKAAVRQYVVVRSIAESYADIQLAALRYQSAQRLWQEVSPNRKDPDFYALAAEGKRKDKGKGKEKGKGDKGGKGEANKDSNAKGKGTGHIRSKTNKCLLGLEPVIVSRNLPMMPKRRTLLVTRAVRAPNLARKMMAKAAKTKVMERTKLARPMLR